MARKRDRNERGHPVFWLLLGFLCGVMAMLGGLLLLVGEGSGGDAPVAAAPEAAAPVAPSIPNAPPGGPVVLIPTPPNVEPATPIQEPVVKPTLPTFQPEPLAVPARPAQPRPSPPAAAKPAVVPRPTPGRSNADQMAEDAAASGMTARTR